MDTLLNADGTFTLTFYQPLAFSGDVLEGVVTGVPNSVTGQVPIVVTDSVFAGSVSVLSAQANPGDQILLTVSAANPFQIISKGLQIPTTSNGFQNSTSVSDILPGQTIAFPILTFTAQAGITPGTATSHDVALRFSRFSAVMTNPTSPVFNATTFPSFFGITTPQVFQTTSGRLSLDGVSDLTSVPAGGTFSTSALFVGETVSPQFSAQSVRKH